VEGAGDNKERVWGNDKGQSEKRSMKKRCPLQSGERGGIKTIGGDLSNPRPSIKFIAQVES